VTPEASAPGGLGRLLGRSLFRSTLVYTGASVLSNAVPFALLPLLTRWLSPTGYGLVAMFQVAVGVAGCLVGLSVHGAVARQYYERERVDFPRYVGNCLLILLGSGVLCGLAAWLARDAISRVTGLPAQALWLVGAACLAQFVLQIALSIWQVEGRPWRYGVFQIGSALANLGLSCLLVIGIGLGWQGRAIGQVAGVAAVATLALLLLWREGAVSWRPHGGYVRHALSFGLPLVPHALGGYAMVAADRVVVADRLGVDQAGLFLAGAQVALVVMVLLDAFNKAWVPWLYARLKTSGSEADRISLVRGTYGVFALVLVFALAWGLAAGALLPFAVGESFAGARVVVLWLALAYAFDGLYKLVGNYLFYAERTRLIAIITGVVAALHLPMLWLGIRWNGLEGAAQAVLGSYMLYFVITWIVSARVFPLPWRSALSPRVHAQL